MNKHGKEHEAKRGKGPADYGTLSITAVSDREDVMMGMGQICQVTVDPQPQTGWDVYQVAVQCRPEFREPPFGDDLIDEILRSTPAHNESGEWIARNVPDFMCGQDNWVYAAAVFVDRNNPGNQERHATIYTDEGVLQTCSTVCNGYPAVEELPPEEVTSNSPSATSTSVKRAYYFTLASDPAEGQADLAKPDQGHRFVKQSGGPFGGFLKFSTVKVYAACVQWTPGGSSDEICDPAGNGDIDLRDYRWTFRMLPQYSVVLYQPGGPLHVITARNEGEGQIIAFDENKPVCLQVNQRRDQYEHNEGKITIVIEQL